MSGTTLQTRPPWSPAAAPASAWPSPSGSPPRARSCSSPADGRTNSTPRSTEIGSGAEAVPADSADLDDLDALYSTVVSSAGAGRRAGRQFRRAEPGRPSAEMTEEQVDKTFGTNVKGVLFTVQKALPLLTDDASVILTGSTTSLRRGTGSRRLLGEQGGGPQPGRGPGSSNSVEPGSGSTRRAQARPRRPACSACTRRCRSRPCSTLQARECHSAGSADPTEIASAAASSWPPTSRALSTASSSSSTAATRRSEALRRAGGIHGRVAGRGQRSRRPRLRRTVAPQTMRGVFSRLGARPSKRARARI